jgi:murein DD-endopeptidase MepM/ murein hydrolase activator NlpD
MKPPRFARTAILGGTAVIAIAAAVLVVGGRKARPPAAKAPESAAAAAVPAAPALVTDEIVIERGQTLAKILSRRSFTGQEIDRLRTEVKAQLQPPVDLGRISAGRTLRFISDRSGSVRTIEYLLDDDGFVRVVRDGPHFKAERIAYLFETRLVHVSGIIEDNPINAVTDQGESAVLAITMTDLFAWDIDFYTELRRGDAFRMAVEKRFLDGRFAGYGSIVAADFVCQGRRFEAFRFEIPDPAKPGAMKADYYDRAGRSVRKEFLRSPLPYARITSRFSFSRLHPIAKVYRAHFGVDYGAPVGTPVQATADGEVLEAGWNGGAGNMVHLKHKNNYETMYLHLSRIYVKRGDRVTGGKTIVGLVGSTGESTGPHLDYRIKQGGSYLNPLAWKFQPQAPLPAVHREEFGKRVVVYDLLLDAPLRLAGRGLSLF